MLHSRNENITAVNAASIGFVAIIVAQEDTLRHHNSGWTEAATQDLPKATATKPPASPEVG